MLGTPSRARLILTLLRRQPERSERERATEAEWTMIAPPQEYPCASCPILANKRMTKNINYYVEGRIFEWVMGLGMFFGGLQLLFWPNSMNNSSFLFLSSIWPTHITLSALLSLGWIRCCALMLNGQKIFGMKFGPRTRAVCSVLSAIMWIQFTVALLELSVAQGFPSPGIPFWAMFTLGEVYTAYTTVKNG